MIEKYLVGEDLTHHTCRRSIYSHVEKEQEGRGTGGEEAIDKRGGRARRSRGIKRLPLLNLCKEGVFSFSLPPHVSRYTTIAQSDNHFI